MPSLGTVLSCLGRYNLLKHKIEHQRGRNSEGAPLMLILLCVLTVYYFEFIHFCNEGSVGWNQILKRVDESFSILFRPKFGLRRKHGAD